MVDISFVIPGSPRGKERPRATRQGRVYTPEKTVNAEALIKLLASDAMQGRDLLGGPLEMTIDLVMPIPASFSKKKREQALSGVLMPLSKPDVDNCAKLVADACNKILYQDDSAIVRMALVKRYGEVPCTVVTVSRISEARRAFYAQVAELFESFQAVGEMVDA